MRKSILLALSALALAGCGNGAANDKAVAQAFKSALYSRELTLNGAAQPPPTPLCSHQDGSSFVCVVGQIGYSVTDDGHVLSWQLSQ